VKGPTTQKRKVSSDELILKGIDFQLSRLVARPDAFIRGVREGGKPLQRQKEKEIIYFQTGEVFGEKSNKDPIRP